MAFKTPKNWAEVPLAEIDQKVYGRTVQAFRREDDGLMLVHHKYVGPRNPSYKKCGLWYVAYEGRLIRRKCYYNSVSPTAPFRWAREWASRWFKERAS